MRYRVATIDELPPGGRRIIEVNETSIGVFNINGSFFAIENHCPHQGGPVCNGKVLPKLSASVLPGGEVRETLSDEPDTIACPWHGWEYDIRTGACLANPRKSVAVFQVTQEDGELFVELAGAATNGDRAD